MGVTEKKLYKQYQKKLKDMNIKQFTDEEYQEAIKNLKKGLIKISKAENDMYISWGNMSEEEKAEFFKSNPFKIKKHE